MSLNHNSQEYNSIFSADNSTIFNNETDRILEEGKLRFNNATTLDDKYQTIQTIHLLFIKQFQKQKDNINADNMSNWLKEVCNNSSVTAKNYIDVHSYKEYVHFIMFVFHFWNGIATWLHNKNNKDNTVPIEYPTFAGNFDCCEYYSDKILVWDHQQTLYKQFLYHTIKRNDTVNHSFNMAEKRNSRWRQNLNLG